MNVRLCLGAALALAISGGAVAAPPKNSIQLKPHPQVEIAKPAGAVKPMLLPDLAVTALSVSPNTSKSGEAVHFSATVKNEGSVASAPAKLAFKFNPAGFAEVQLPGLQPGQSATRTIDNTFILIGGMMNVTAVADSKSTVLEKNESNNSRQAVFNVQCRPELAAYDILQQNVPLSVYGHPGAKTAIQLQVKNYGCAAAPAFNVNIGCPGIWPEAQAVSGLAPGQSTTVKVEYTFPESKIYACTAVVDPGNYADEAIETNNRRIINVNIAPVWPE